MTTKHRRRSTRCILSSAAVRPLVSTLSQSVAGLPIGRYRSWPLPPSPASKRPPAFIAARAAKQPSRAAAPDDSLSPMQSCGTRPSWRFLLSRSTRPIAAVVTTAAGRTQQRDVGVADCRSARCGVRAAWDGFAGAGRHEREQAPTASSGTAACPGVAKLLLNARSRRSGCLLASTCAAPGGCSGVTLAMRPMLVARRSSHASSGRRLSSFAAPPQLIEREQAVGGPGSGPRRHAIGGTRLAEG